MRFVLICILIVVAAFAAVRTVPSQEAESEKGDTPERLLTEYLKNRLQQAQLAFESLMRQKEEGVVTLPQVLAAEDAVDKGRLDYVLATEGKLISNHPVLNEIRRQYGVPAITELQEDQNARVVSSAVLDYLQRRVQRAERLLESAAFLHKMKRATEGDVLDAKTRLDGLNLLLEVERRKAAVMKAQSGI